MIKNIELLIIGEIYYQCYHRDCGLFYKIKPIKCLFCDRFLFKKVRIVIGDGLQRKAKEVIDNVFREKDLYNECGCKAIVGVSLPGRYQ